MLATTDETDEEFLERFAEHLGGEIQFTGNSRAVIDTDDDHEDAS